MAGQASAGQGADSVEDGSDQGTEGRTRFRGVHGAEQAEAEGEPAPGWALVCPGADGGTDERAGKDGRVRQGGITASGAVRNVRADADLDPHVGVAGRVIRVQGCGPGLSDLPRGRRC